MMQLIFHVSIRFFFICARSTRVSNELGAGRPQAARIAVYTVMILAIIEVIIVSGTLFGTRDIFGYSFSNEKEVVDYVSNMTPLVCLSVILDGLQVVLSG
jgi:MATE family multidrug resistance protein